MHRFKGVASSKQSFCEHCATKWFLEAANGQPMDWHDVFEHYQAAVDWPASAYYKNLLETFPEALVIFSDRPAEAWYDSVAYGLAYVGYA